MTDNKTATERLRELLDAQGVEWSSEEVKSWDGKVSYCYTYWGDGEGFCFCEPMGAQKGTLGALCDFSAIGFTPEQAVAATLGNKPTERTCTNVHEPPKDTTFWPAPHFKCSECGATHVSMEYVFFCPNCGAKVVDE